VAYVYFNCKVTFDVDKKGETRRRLVLRFAWARRRSSRSADRLWLVLARGRADLQPVRGFRGSAFDENAVAESAVAQRSTDATMSHVPNVKACIPGHGGRHRSVRDPGAPSAGTQKGYGQGSVVLGDGKHTVAQVSKPVLQASRAVARSDLHALLQPRRLAAANVAADTHVRGPVTGRSVSGVYEVGHGRDRR